MFIDRLLNQGSTPLLESMLEFTAARHRLIAENVVNVDTPNYRQKDLSVSEFQTMMSRRLERRRDAAPGSVRFDDIRSEIEHPHHGILFHDGNNRSMEQLMTEQAKNALMHNMAVEMLRKQYQTMELALRGRLA